jgi:predicted DNA-binding protein YlxM (UPF0122 family)
MAIISTEKVIHLLNSGKKATQIAKKYNITRNAVYYHIDKLRKKERNTESYPDKLKIDYNPSYNWSIYNDGLVKRGEIIFDFDQFKNWDKELESMNKNKVGRQYQYPDSYIKFLLKLKSIFQVDYRTLQGISNRLVILIPHAKASADYTTLQKRFQEQEIKLEVYEESEKQEIAGDSSGLKTSQRGEYRMNKYRDGVKKKYIKLHLAVNIKNNQVVSCIVTDEAGRDNKQMDDLIDEASEYGEIISASFDRGYDSKENYWFLRQQGIKDAIKPRKTMKLSKLKEEIPKIKLRIQRWDEKYKSTVKLKQQLCRMEELEYYLEDPEGWKKQKNYGQRWKSEAMFSVLKRVFGDAVFSKDMKAIQNEVMMKISMMNKFTSITIKAKKDLNCMGFT